jgi:hypothetical protein
MRFEPSWVVKYFGGVDPPERCFDIRIEATNCSPTPEELELLKKCEAELKSIAFSCYGLENNPATQLVRSWLCTAGVDERRRASP